MPTRRPRRWCWRGASRVARCSTRPPASAWRGVWVRPPPAPRCSESHRRRHPRRCAREASAPPQWGWGPSPWAPRAPRCCRAASAAAATTRGPSVRRRASWHSHARATASRASLARSSPSAQSPTASVPSAAPSPTRPPSTHAPPSPPRRCRAARRCRRWTTTRRPPHCASTMPGRCSRRWWSCRRTPTPRCAGAPRDCSTGSVARRSVPGVTPRRCPAPSRSPPSWAGGPATPGWARWALPTPPPCRRTTGAPARATCLR
mmetsp:Transcript_62057/g.149480  ORF Transcript_62057/g.149480 Transcript_62057/m.149480 type:complete len:261 (+) Transcript_62057:148-930(+)